MALSDLTFKLYTDSGLTTLFGGTLSLTHESDFSDNPQDFHLYFGSTILNRVLQAESNPGVDQVTLTPTYILPIWVASTAYSVGDSVIPTSPNGKRYTVTSTSGSAPYTSGGSQPTWPTTVGQTVVDNELTWTCTADDRPITEITLGLTSGDLDTNTPGDPLDLGTDISSGVSNAVDFYVRIDNTITTVSTTFGNPELGVNINTVMESDT